MRLNIPFFLCLMAGAMGGCLPDPNYPVEPTLAFDAVIVRPDGTAEMVLRFTDGDGDVGLTQADTLPPHFCATCPHHYNLVGEYQLLNDTGWVTPILPIPFAYRVPVAEPTGSSPSLDGTIAIELSSWGLLGAEGDSIRFLWTLWDRALNGSDVARTPAFPAP